MKKISDILKVYYRYLTRTMKRDGEVSLSYMKGFERDAIMYEEGRRAEQKNTERERKRAELAEKEKERAAAKITELEMELERLKRK